MYDARVRAVRQALLAVLWAGSALASTQLADAPLTASGVDESDPAYARVANPAFPSPEVHEVPIDRGLALSRADLAPYFATGRLAEAHAAFVAQQWAKTRDLLSDAPDTAPVRFLRALAALRGSDNAFASKEFEALADAWPVMRDRCLVYAGFAYEALKDVEGSARVFTQVSPKSRLSVDAALGLSRARKSTKDVPAALAALQPFVDKPAPPWGRDVGAEALLALADVQAWKGDKKGEKTSLLKIWSAHPLSPQAKKAEERLGDVSDAPKELLVTRAETLIDAHRNAQGLAIVEPLLEGLKLPDALACRAHFAAGKGNRKERHHARAVAQLGPVVKKCKDAELRARALYTLGFSQSIVAPLGAAETYETLAHEYPDHPYADDSLYFAADALLRSGFNERGIETLHALVDRYPPGDYTADDARVYLEEIEGRFVASEDSYELERATFWRGKLLEKGGDTAQASAAWATLAQAHPATYYGLRAREHVAAIDAERGASLAKAVAAAPAGVDPFPIHAGPLSTDPQFLSAVELLRLGLGELVPMELLAIDRTGLPPDSLRLMVHVLSQSGEERAAHGMARLWLRRDLSGPITPASRSLWEIAYPNAFRPLVLEHSLAADELDADLLQALMREESALDPKALSWAGALGLCQLMPTTAAGVAAQLRLKYPGQAALLEPGLNIQLGARYLSDLVIRAKGTKQYALAGYNAGEGSVARWRKEFGDEDLDAWVEQIPLQETRGYVKRVLRSYNTYKLLYAPGELAQTQGPLPKPRPKPTPVKPVKAAPVKSGA
jgi:soluble lytic murein transglycosylase